MEIKFIESNRVHFDLRYNARQPVFIDIELVAFCARPSYFPDVLQTVATRRMRAMLRRMLWPGCPQALSADTCLPFAHGEGAVSLGTSGPVTATDSLAMGMTGSFQTLRYAIASGYAKVYS